MRLKRGNTILSLGFPEICAAAFMIGAGEGKTLLIALISAIAHEGGHILTMFLFGSGVGEFRFSPVGGMIRFSRQTLSYKKDIISAFAGPAVSGAAAGLLYLIYRRHPDDILLQAAITNTLYAAMNLLPVRPLDGYRILRGILYNAGKIDAEKRLRAAGVFTVMIIILLFSFLCAEWRFNASLFIFTAFLILYLDES